MSETNYNKGSAEMTYIGTMADGDSWWDWAQKSEELGAFFYTHDYSSMWCRSHNTHSDNGSWCRWAINPNKLDNGAGWNWDGNIEKPTLNPSIHNVGEWHGWMRAGRLESC